VRACVNYIRQVVETGRYNSDKNGHSKKVSPDMWFPREQSFISYKGRKGELQALEKPIIHRAKSKMDEKLFNGSLLNLIYFVEPLSTSNFFFKFPLRNSR